MGILKELKRWFTEDTTEGIKCEKRITRSAATVNGKRYEMSLSGGNITISNGKVYQNGKLVENCNERSEKEIYVIVNGDADKIVVDSGNVEVKGNVFGGVEADCGNVEIHGHVDGNVTTDCGNVDCGDVKGNVRTDCGNISHR